MLRTVVPPRTWVPVDYWLTADRVRRDTTLGEPTSFEEVERVDKRRRATARRGQAAQ